MKLHEKKLKRFKAYEVIANVIFIIILVFSLLGLVAAITTESIVAAKQVDIARFVQSLADKYVPDLALPDMPSNAFFHALIIFFISGTTLGLAFICYLFKSVSRLFGNIVKTETPFHEKSIKILKSIGIAFFVYTAADFILGVIMSAMMSGLLHGHFNLNISIQLSTIIYGLLILTLAEIFEYGASLQRDSESIV